MKWKLQNVKLVTSRCNIVSFAFGLCLVVTIRSLLLVSDTASLTSLHHLQLYLSASSSVSFAVTLWLEWSGNKTSQLDLCFGLGSLSTCDNVKGCVANVRNNGHHSKRKRKRQSSHHEKRSSTKFVLCPSLPPSYIWRLRARIWKGRVNKMQCENDDPRLDRGRSRTQHPLFILMPAPTPGPTPCSVWHQIASPVGPLVVSLEPIPTTN